MPRYFICQRRATWLPKPGELVYHVPMSSFSDMMNPIVLEYETVGRDESHKFPGDDWFFVRHQGGKSLSDGRYHVRDLYQTPQEALLCVKHRLLEAVAKIDWSMLEATRIYYEQRIASGGLAHPPAQAETGAAGRLSEGTGVGVPDGQKEGD